MRGGLVNVKLAEVRGLGPAGPCWNWPASTPTRSIVGPTMESYVGVGAAAAPGLGVPDTTVNDLDAGMVAEGGSGDRRDRDEGSTIHPAQSAGLGVKAEP